jgi:serine/threonine-protein kinase
VLRKVQIVSPEGPTSNPLISPNGTRLFFRAGGKSWLRDLRTWDAREVPAMDATSGLFWSPDSGSIGYRRENAIWTRTVPDGKELAVAPLPAEAGDGFDAAWTDDGTIVFTTESGPLYAVSSAGGTVTPLYAAAPPDVVDFHAPSRLPGNAGVLAVVHRPGGEDAIAVVSTQGRTVVIERPGEKVLRCAFSPTGHLVFELGAGKSGIWAVPFSLTRLAATGRPYSLDPDGNDLSVSADGTLAYLVTHDIENRLVWLTRHGEEGEAIQLPHGGFFGPALSPEGRRVAANVIDKLGVSLWVYDLERGTRTRVTPNPTDLNPLWRGPDHVVFRRGASARTGTAERMGPAIMEARADGSGGERVLVENANTPSLTADGRFIVANQRVPGRQDQRLFWLDLEKTAGPAPFGDPHSLGVSPSVSPNGRFVAYVSSKSGRPEVYLTRFPGGEGLWPVSSDGVTLPVRWSPDSREIFFQSDGWLVAVTVGDGPGAPALGKPQRLFRTTLTGYHFSVSPDGRLLAAVPVERQGGDTELRLVFNWATESSAR